MAETILFVYGTLRRGERAHGLVERSRALGTVRTAPRYDLMNLGPFPALASRGRTAVQGELYGVSEALIAHLDRYEGSDYRRGPVELEDGQVVEAYFAGPEIEGLGEAIPSGDWLASRAPGPARGRR